MGRDEKFFRRLIVVAFFMLAISAILIVRLLSFQFRMDPMVKQRLETQAENRYIQTVEVYPNRARFTTATATSWRSTRSSTGLHQPAPGARPPIRRAISRRCSAWPEDEIYPSYQPGADGNSPPTRCFKPVVGFVSPGRRSWTWICRHGYRSAADA